VNPGDAIKSDSESRSVNAILEIASEFEDEVSKLMKAVAIDPLLPPIWRLARFEDDFTNLVVPRALRWLVDRWNREFALTNSLRFVVAHCSGRTLGRHDKYAREGFTNGQVSRIADASPSRDHWHELRFKHYMELFTEDSSISRLILAKADKRHIIELHFCPRAACDRDRGKYPPGTLFDKETAAEIPRLCPDTLVQYLDVSASDTTLRGKPEIPSVASNQRLASSFFHYLKVVFGLPPDIKACGRVLQALATYRTLKTPERPLAEDHFYFFPTSSLLQREISLELEPEGMIQPSCLGMVLENNLSKLELVVCNEFSRSLFDRKETITMQLLGAYSAIHRINSAMAHQVEKVFSELDSRSEDLLNALLTSDKNGELVKSVEVLRSRLEQGVNYITASGSLPSAISLYPNHHEIWRVDALVSNAIEMAELSDGTAKQRIQVVGKGDYFAKLRTITTGTSRAPHATVTTENKIPIVNGDVYTLILWNLIVNALAITTESGGQSTVKIDFGSQLESECWIEIADDGTGFQKADFEAIEPGGSGLRIVRWLLTVANGRLELMPNSTGAEKQGTRIRIYLPSGES